MGVFNELGHLKSQPSGLSTGLYKEVHKAVQRTIQAWIFTENIWLMCDLWGGIRLSALTRKNIMLKNNYDYFLKGSTDAGIFNLT